jgi:hypothetical protein
MEIKEAIKILELHNKWRRGEEDIEMTDPLALGEAIDVVVNYFNNRTTKDMIDWGKGEICCKTLFKNRKSKSNKPPKR